MDTANSTPIDTARAPARTGVAADDDDRCQVVTVFSSTSGAGTTTVAINLAATLAQDGHTRVCLVDLDAAFREISAAMSLDSATGLGDAVHQSTLDVDSVLALLTPHPAGVSVLLAPDARDDTTAVPPAVLTRVLGVLRGQFDYVVIDTPSTFDELVLAAFEASDRIVTVATFDVEPLKDLRLTLETLGLLAAPGRVSPPEAGWRIVINRVESSTGLAAAEAGRTLPVPVCAELPLSDELEGSPPPGSPLVVRCPQDAFSVAVQALAHDQIRSADGRRQGPEHPQRRTLGALRRLWRP